MTRLLRAESSKLLTLRVTYVALLLTGAASAGLTALITHTMAAHNGDLAIRREAVTIAGTDIAPGIALLLGMLIGSEFRHNTITPALLITPLRQRLVLAKTVVAAMAGVVLAAVATVAALGAAAVTGSAQLLDATDIASLTGTTIVLCMLFGIAGVGIGTLIRNPTTALIVAMSALYLVDPLLGQAIPDSALPKSASEVVGLSSVEAQGVSLWLAMAVVVSYVIAVITGALRFALPRDVT
jgi:hypothetical protein